MSRVKRKNPANVEARFTNQIRCDRTYDPLFLLYRIVSSHHPAAKFEVHTSRHLGEGKKSLQFTFFFSPQLRSIN